MKMRLFWLTTGPEARPICEFKSVPPTNTFHFSLGLAATTAGVDPVLRLSCRKRGQASVGSACGLVDIVSSAQRASPHVPFMHCVPLAHVWMVCHAPSIPHCWASCPMHCRSPGLQVHAPLAQPLVQGVKSYPLPSMRHTLSALPSHAGGSFGEQTIPAKSKLKLGPSPAPPSKPARPPVAPHPASSTIQGANFMAPSAAPSYSIC